jgi:FkbM family methyltransferase
VARGAYALGLRRTVRALVRPAVHGELLSLRNRQRLYNFFADDTVTDDTVVANVRTPSGRPVAARLDLADEFCRIWYYWGYERYEPGVARLLTTLARQRRVIVEAGANIGYYTLLMATAQPAGATVHAFEPRPDVFARLSENIALNALTSVRLNDAAVSDTAGRATLYLPDSGNREMASLDRSFAPAMRSIDVRTVRLDAYCASNGLAVDLLKLDVEGSEVRALEGLGTVLRDRWPDIVCEVLPQYEAALNTLVAGTPYRRFLITDNGLEERSEMVGSLDARDYYLTTEMPKLKLGPTYVSFVRRPEL